jgi:SAM-dependent methyltransferase
MTEDRQTASTFREKWSRNPDLAFRQTLDEGSEIFQWILGRNGFDGAKDLTAFLADKRRILDAGCGNGRVTALLRRYAAREAEVVGFDLTAADVARANLAGLEGVTVLEGDILGDLSGLGSFDFIYCQEVLHHTGDPEGGLRNLATLLEPGGEIAIYVYRRKAPIREFADDYVRDQISALPYEDAMVECRGIAELGRALAEVGATVTVPQIDVLGIEAGEYDVQRLVYHHLLKCFWNDELDAEANAAINFDWYHPQVSTRHTVDECRAWFRAAGLDVIWEHVDPYGITMRGASSSSQSARGRT